MKLTILGNNSALPAYGRNPTAQYLEHNGVAYLIDCGEGTQMRIQQYNLKLHAIDYIFISHLHGDHFFGLVGLLSSLSLLGRERSMSIFCPRGLKEIILIQLQFDLGFEIMWHEDEEDGIILERKDLNVSQFRVYHSLPTKGFLFEEIKRKRKLNLDKVREYEIPKYFYSKLTDGCDYETKDGKIISNDLLTIENEPGSSYAYCADTRFALEIVPIIKGVSLLYHEATYLHTEIEKAKARLHSTAKQAAEIAKGAQVKQLLIGHFSSKYKDTLPLLEEAMSVFKYTRLATEGECFVF